MHAERDHLIKAVFPALRERLEKHRIDLIDIDRRWGGAREQVENDLDLERSSQKEEAACCQGRADGCRMPGFNPPENYPRCSFSAWPAPALAGTGVRPPFVLSLSTRR